MLLIYHMSLISYHSIILFFLNLLSIFNFYLQSIYIIVIHYYLYSDAL